MYFPPSPWNEKYDKNDYFTILELEFGIGIPKEMFYENPKTDEVRSKYKYWMNAEIKLEIQINIYFSEKNTKIPVFLRSLYTIWY